MDEVMNVSASRKKNAMIVAVEGRLDSVTSGELEAWVDETLVPPTCDVVMNFSDLDYISSAGLRVMLNISKLVNNSSYRFSMCGVQDHVKEVFEISGFDSFIPIYKSVEDSVS